VADVFPEVYESQIRPRFDRAFGGERVDYELSKPVAGGVCYYEVRYEPSKVNGAVTMVVVVITEITERKKAEMASLRLAAIVEFSDDAIIGKDLNSIITSWNKGAEKVFGYTAEEMVGTSIMRLIPDDRKEEEEQILSKIRCGESVEHFETLRLTKDGRLIHISVTASPIKDAAGVPVGVSKVARDITERKRAAAALIESEGKFRLLAENITDVFWIASPDLHRVDYVSPGYERIWGCSTESLYANPHQWSDTIVPEDRDRALGAFARLMKNESSVGVEYRIKRPDGAIRWVHDRGFQVRDATGKLVRLTGIVADITERKQVEQQLTLLNTCISNLNDIVIVTEADPIDEPGPRIVFVNEAFERITGYTAAEAIGQSPRFLQGEKTDRRVLDEIRQALTLHQPIRRQVLNYGKHGNEYWLDIDIVPIFDSTGKCTHFTAIERDITEAKKAGESRRLFRNLVDRSNDAIEVVDPKSGRFLDVNETACRRLGYSREELLAMSIPDVAIVGGRPPSMVDEVEAIKKAGFRVFEAIYRRKDGSTYPVEVNVQFIQLDKDYLVAVVRDITERKKAEELVLSAEGRYRTLFDYAPDGIIIANSEGIYLDGNPSLCRMLGYTHGELVGRQAADIVVPTEIQHVDPALREIYTGAGHHREWQFRRKDGSAFAAEVIATKMPDGNLLAVFRDVTERKKAEEQIAEQAAFLDKARDAILARDLEGKILFWNKGAEHLYGWTSTEVVGRNAGDVLYADRKKFEEVSQIALSQGEWQGELQHKSKEGREIIIEARWTLIRDNEGRPKSILAINTDITEKKKIEAQFMRAQRMESIGTLAGGIAHDLNNILAPIMMSIDILKATSDTPQTKQILETIEVSAKRGADIVRQVLSFARGLEGERIEVQPKHLLKDLESIIKDTFPKDIRLKFTVPRDIWTISGDPTQIHQILLNLCVNARDAMPHGGALTVSVENFELDQQYAAMNIHAKPGRFVQISVTDSGTGIPPELLDKIFEPFFTTKDLHKGTGLGLSTVMAVVKSHEGIINVYSEPGRGTTFKVYLPAIDSSPEAKKEKAEEANLPRGNGETVLIVDDEASILTITGQTLQAFGYRVLTATDGADAVAVYARNMSEVSVVLTDMMMPVMDGSATIHALMRINPAVKIIAASGLNANGGVAKASGDGVKHFLMKPYTAGMLLKTLRAILSEP